MTRLVLSPRLRDDIARIVQHLQAHEADGVAGRIDEVLDALPLLTRHPLIGRPAPNGRRELVIGKGARGYVALYFYDDRLDEVVVVALRAQREAGFREVGS